MCWEACCRKWLEPPCWGSARSAALHIVEVVFRGPSPSGVPGSLAQLAQPAVGRLGKGDPPLQRRTTASGAVRPQVQLLVLDSAGEKDGHSLPIHPVFLPAVQPWIPTGEALPFTASNAVPRFIEDATAQRALDVACPQSVTRLVQDVPVPNPEVELVVVRGAVTQLARRPIDFEGIGKLGEFWVLRQVGEGLLLR
jgi:hypothetical protein